MISPLFFNFYPGKKLFTPENSQNSLFPQNYIMTALTLHIDFDKNEFYRELLFIKVPAIFSREENY
jgi:hypothetical protein